MGYEHYRMLRVDIAFGVATITVGPAGSAGPINLLGRELFAELAAVGPAVAADDSIRAVVLQSDTQLLQRLLHGPPPAMMLHYLIS